MRCLASLKPPNSRYISWAGVPLGSILFHKNEFSRYPKSSLCFFYTPCIAPSIFFNSQIQYRLPFYSHLMDKGSYLSSGIPWRREWHGWSSHQWESQDRAFLYESGRLPTVHCPFLSARRGIRVRENCGNTLAFELKRTSICVVPIPSATSTRCRAQTTRAIAPNDCSIV